MMNDLETQLIASRKIREFLKNFSETQWSRVVKASIMMGIQELEKTQPVVTKLSVKDLEEIVVHNESQMSEIKKKLTTDQSLDSIKLNNERRASSRSNQSRQNLRKNSDRSSLSGSKSQFKSEFTTNQSVPVLLAKKPDSSSQIKDAQKQNLFKNSFQQLALRRRDLDSDIFWTHRSSSQPTEGTITARFQSKKTDFDQQTTTQNTDLKSSQKPDGQWRQPKISQFQRNGQRLKNRLFNEDISKQIQEQKRSRSLNPLIYPEWWGEEDAEEQTQSQTTTNRKKSEEKPQFVNLKYDHEDREDSLDRRLKEAKEAAAKLDKMFQFKQINQQQIQNHFPQQHQINQKPQNSKENSLSPPPTQTFYHQMHDSLVQQQSQVQQPQIMNLVRQNKENQGPNYKYHQFQNQKQSNISGQQQPIKQAKPAYLKNVESKIRDKVKKDRAQNNLHQNTNFNQNQGIRQPEVQIYVKEQKTRENPTRLRQAEQTQEVYNSQEEYYEYQSQLQPQQQDFSNQQHQNAYYHQGAIHQQQQNPRSHLNDKIGFPEQHPRANQLINVAKIADGFLSSPLMTQFSEDQDNNETPASQNQQYQSNTNNNQTLQISSYKQTRHFQNSNQFKSQNTTNFINQTILSNPDMMNQQTIQSNQNRNQQSTFYNHNPFSYIQQEEDEGQSYIDQSQNLGYDPISQNSYPPVRTQNYYNNQGTFHRGDQEFQSTYAKQNQNQQNQNSTYYHKGQQSAVGMTMILNNLNNNTMLSDAQGLFKSNVFDQNQTYMNEKYQQRQHFEERSIPYQFSGQKSNYQRNDQNMTNYQTGAQIAGHFNQFLERVPEEDSKLMSGISNSNVQSNQLITKNHQAKERNQTDQSQDRSPRINQYTKPLQEQDNQGIVYGQLMRESKLSQNHRATVSQPFEYMPRKNELQEQKPNYQQSFYPTHVNEAQQPHLMSPSSDDPHHYSQSYGQTQSINQTQGHVGFTQILKRDNSNNHMKDRTPERNDDHDISKSSMYSKTDNIRQMFSDPSNKYLQQEISQNTSMIDTQQTKQNLDFNNQHHLQMNQNPIHYQQKNHDLPLIQNHVNPSQNRLIVNQNDSVTSPSSYDGSSMIDSQIDASPNTNQLITKLRTNQMNTSSSSDSDEDDGNDTLSDQSSYFSNDQTLSDATNSQNNPHKPQQHKVYNYHLQNQGGYQDLNPNQLQKSSHIQKPLDRNLQLQDQNTNIPLNGQIQRFKGEQLPQTFSFQKSVQGSQPSSHRYMDQELLQQHHNPHQFQYKADPKVGRMSYDHANQGYVGNQQEQQQKQYSQQQMPLSTRPDKFTFNDEQQ
eukprot:403343816